MLVSAFNQSLILPDRPFRILDSYTRNTLFTDRSLWLDPAKTIPQGPPPFDSFHYWYYQDRAATEPPVETARQQTIFDHGCMEIAQGQKPMLYRPFSITGGVASHQLAIDVNHRQTFDLAGKTALLRTTRDMHLSQAGRERLFQDVISQNKRDAEYLNKRISRNFADYALVDPFDKEGAVRINRMDSDASFGRAPLEEDFMGGWYRLVDYSQGMVWTPNVAFSRNGNWEEMRGIFCATGFLNGIARTSGSYGVYRVDRSRAPFAERLQYNLDYLLYAAENDFHASEAATCAAWKLEIAARLSDEAYNAASYHPIVYGNVDPVLMAEFRSGEDWAKTCRARIGELREALEPLLLGHFAAHIRQEHMRPLDDRYHYARTAGGRTFSGWSIEPSVVAQARLRLADPGIYRTADPSDPALVVVQGPRETVRNLSQAFDGVAAQRQLAHIENVFDISKYGAQVFEDNIFARLNKRERIVAQRVIGAMLSVNPPALTPAHTLVLADLDKGTHGLQVAQQEGIFDLGQLREILGDPEIFNRRVEHPNLMAVARLARASAKKTAGPVISTVDIVGIQKAFAWLGQITAVPGYGQSSPDFRMSLRLKMMDLMADTVVLEKDWACSDDQAQHVVRATMIQMGLVERGHLHRHNLVLKNSALEPMSFADRFIPLCRHLEECILKGVKARQHTLAVSRLIECYEMLIDPSSRPGMVDVNAMPHSLLADFHRHESRQELEVQVRVARDIIAKHCVDWLEEQDLVGLNEDMRDAWMTTRRDKKIAFTPSPSTAAMKTTLGARPG